jgi:hypothetical protein
MSLLIPSKQKLNQIISKIPDTHILACVLSNGLERNNEIFLEQTINAEAPSLSKPIQINSVRFLTSKDREFMIGELTPDIKSNILTVLGQPNPDANMADNFFALMVGRFPNWFFTPVHKELASKMPYFSDKPYPRSDAVIISDNIGPSDFMSQYLSGYLEISCCARITNVWVIADETILLSFINQGQELLFYYRRY